MKTGEDFNHETLGYRQHIGNYRGFPPESMKAFGTS